MGRRGIVSWVIACNLVALVSAQNFPGTRLLITALGSNPSQYQSFLYSVDPGTGATTTLYDDISGNFLNICMDRDNVGFSVVYKGRVETGIHFLTPGGAVASIVDTVRILNPDGNFLCANLSSEDAWIVGTEASHGHGRLRIMVPLYRIFHDMVSFPGYEVADLVVERKTAKFILGLNGKSGVVLSFNPYTLSQTTLASGLGRITDLIQEPASGGFLVSTQDKTAPLLYVSGSSRNNSIVKTFHFPRSIYPQGTSVDALALDVGVEIGESCGYDLWALVGNQLYALCWDRKSQEIIFPSPLTCYTLPVMNTTEMIFQGNRNYLLTTQKNAGCPEVTLRIRLGPQYANQDYYIGASLAMTPGIVIAGNRMINLAPGPLFWMSLSGQLPLVFDEFSGSTGPGGEVTGKVVGKKEWRSSLTGVTIYFAGVIIDPSLPGRIRTVTNTVGLTLF